MEKYYQVNIQFLGLDGEELVVKELRYASKEDFLHADQLSYHIYHEAVASEKQQAEGSDFLRTDDEVKFGSQIKETDLSFMRELAMEDLGNTSVNNVDGLSADDMTNNN